jgi:hypothetical protein
MNAGPKIIIKGTRNVRMNEGKDNVGIMYE